MSKRKLDQIDGHEPWEIEVAYLVEQLKVEPIDARAMVVISWMYRGDDRPLAAALRHGSLDPPVLNQLLKMVDAGEFIAGNRGAPTQPGKSTRDLVIAFRYANRDGKSTEAIQQIARGFNISEELVRRAIRRRPKYNLNTT
jgi:hypothetical protein